MSEPDFLSANFWNDRYLQKQTGWDIGSVSRPLKEYIDTLTDTSIDILIPGAGNAYEALYLLQKGFTHITLLDIAPDLTRKLAEKYPSEKYPGLKIITGDFFLHTGSYDLILEQTFFCAIHPSLRESYVHKMNSLLKGNGKLVGLLFDREFPVSPPFGGKKEAYRQLFQKGLRIQSLESCYNSIPQRADTELFLIAEKWQESPSLS